MKILFRSGYSFALNKKKLDGARRYVGFVVTSYEAHSGAKRKRGVQGLMPGDELSVIGKLPSLSPGLVFEVEIQRTQRAEYKLLAVLSVENTPVTQRILRQIFKGRLKDIFHTYRTTVATVKCPLSLKTINDCNLHPKEKDALKAIFDDSLNFVDRLGCFRLFPLTPSALLEQFRPLKWPLKKEELAELNAMRNDKRNDIYDELKRAPHEPKEKLAELNAKRKGKLNGIYEELKRAPHELLFAKSQTEHFGEAFVCTDPKRVYEELTDRESAPSGKILAAAAIEREIGQHMKSTANTCMPRDGFDEVGLKWGLSKGYFKEVGPLKNGQRHYIGLATACEDAETICQFLRNKRVTVHHGTPADCAAVPNAETLAAVLRGGGRAVVLQKYASQEVLTVAFTHLLRVEDFANFVRLERQFKEVRFYGSLVAKVGRSQSNGRLFQDLVGRFGPIEGVPQRGALVRYADLKTVSGQLLVVTRHQQRAVEASIGLGEHVYKSGQKVQHKAGRVRVLQQCWREDRHGRVNKRYGSVQPGTSDKCFFRFAGDRKKRPFKELYDYHHADVALIHTVQKGGERGVLACESMSKRDELYARELFETLYVPENYGSYPSKEEVNHTLLNYLI